MWKTLLARIGIHVHTWRYYDNVYHQHFRRCACGAAQEFIAVPAAPGGFTIWMDLARGENSGVPETEQP